MFLSSLTLLVALALSAIAAFYSIAGLAAIFSAAVIPIIIMGSTLELAKIVVTVWLHEYWTKCRLLMKTYLVVAVIVLMMITSMGIYGFLSKSHLDQTVPAGEAAAKVALIDEKIKTERDNIEAYKQALKQLDSQVNEMMGRTTDDRGANRSVQIRRQQASERKQLQDSLAQSQKIITQLQNEKAPLAVELRKVEAEVGPIKYIAALIYDEKPDENTLEKAVRWVIITIVFVFDPLAIMMLLAATESFAWNKQKKSTDNKHEPVTDTDTNNNTNQSSNVQSAPPLPDVEPQTVSDPKPKEILAESNSQPPLPVESASSDDNIKTAERIWKTQNPNGSLKKERDLFEHGKTEQLPWNDLAIELDSTLNEPGRIVGHGTKWPKDPQKGDQFLRVDIIPFSLYKFNGRDWIRVNKESTDSYAYDSAYIDYLIGKLSSGEYDPDLLTQAEEEQVAARLGNINNNSMSTK